MLLSLMITECCNTKRAYFKIVNRRASEAKMNTSVIRDSEMSLA